jgi:hypothetical protein
MDMRKGTRPFVKYFDSEKFKIIDNSVSYDEDDMKSLMQDIGIETG